MSSVWAASRGKLKPIWKDILAQAMQQAAEAGCYQTQNFVPSWNSPPSHPTDRSIVQQELSASQLAECFTRQSPRHVFHLPPREGIPWPCVLLPHIPRWCGIDPKRGLAINLHCKAACNDKKEYVHSQWGLYHDMLEKAKQILKKLKSWFSKELYMPLFCVTSLIQAHVS